MSDSRTSFEGASQVSQNALFETRPFDEEFFTQSTQLEAAPSGLGQLYLSRYTNDMGSTTRSEQQGGETQTATQSTTRVGTDTAKTTKYSRIDISVAGPYRHTKPTQALAATTASAAPLLEGSPKTGKMHQSQKGTGNQLSTTAARKAQQLEILDRVLPAGQTDCAELLQKIRARAERVGISQPTVEVRFVDLLIETEVFADVSRNLPSIFRAMRDPLESILQKLWLLRPVKKKLSILSSISGILKPGRFTLLLGPPSSGKSTLLKALSNQLRPLGLKCSGEITYNGKRFPEFQPLRTASYVEQTDRRLLPELTVRETLDFSARCQGSGVKKGLLEAVRARESSSGIECDEGLDEYMAAEAGEGEATSIRSDLMIRMLGLGICADTQVGDALRPACSPGQKKRVTSGEALVGPQLVHYMDEISTGLDSSTTFQIVKYLRELTHQEMHTSLIALLQPAPETFELFDDVMLLSEGHIVYHGPINEMLSFFSQLGFKCPGRKPVADFLQEVTSAKEQKQYWSSRHPYRLITAAEMAERFKFECHLGIATAEELVEPKVFTDASVQDAGLVKTRYALSAREIFKACMGRELLLVDRNRPLYVFRFVQLMLLALVTATLFIRTRMKPTSVADGNLYFGVVFFSLVQLMFDGTIEMQLTQERLPSWYKQRDNHWLTAWAYVFCTTVLRLPFSLLDAAMWSILVYFVTGLAPGADRFFTFLLLLFLLHTLGIAMFRFVAAVCRDETVMAVVGSAFFLILILLGGFLFSAGSIPVWYKWVYWGVNPISYAQKAMAVNEFSAPRWQSRQLPNGQTIGHAILNARGLPAHKWWIWVGVAVIGFATVLYNVMTWLCHAWLSPLDKPAIVLPASLQDQIADEADVAASTKRGEFELASMPTDARKLNERSARRASIAVGLLSSISKQAPLAISGPAAPQPAESGATGLAAALRSVVKPLEASRRKQPLKGTSSNLVGLLDARPSAEVVTSGGKVTVDKAGIRFANRRSVFVDQVPTEVPDEKKDEVISSGMVLPFEPLSLVFSHIDYFVPLPKTMSSTDPEKVGPQAASVQGTVMLQLLSDCSGAFQPGVLTALMGSSGAGKTTLMDVLAGRKTGGKIVGSIMVGGFPKEQASFSRLMGYCQQEDVHAPYTTVEEALWTSCRLRFTNDIDDITAKAFVDEIMDLVELESIRGSLVGLPGQTGLSVGQRKRLTIAVELVANPSIIFMDEPTSGLDARAAAIVMRAVRNTVDTGRTVVCTIHQPSVDIFEAFDELLLVKLGGRVIYHGRIGPTSSILMSYFTDIPEVMAPPAELNPATWILQATTLGVEQRLGIDFADVYMASTSYRDVEQLVEKLSVPPIGKAPIRFAMRYPQSYFAQYCIITRRNFVSYYRNTAYNCTRFAFGIILGLLFGSVLWNVGHKRSRLQDLNNVLGALYLVMVFLGIINATSVQPVAHQERSVLHRECPAGMYSSVPFGLAQCTVELPYVLAQCLLFGTISYWMIAFEADAGKFFWYVFIIYLSLCLQTFYGIMMVYATPNLPVAGVFSSLFFGLWNLFTGFLIGHQRMPRYYSWYYYLNPFAYSLQGIVLSQLGDVADVVALPDGGAVSVRAALAAVFGYHYSFLGYNVLIMISFCICFAVIGLVCLHVLKYQRR